MANPTESAALLARLRENVPTDPQEEIAALADILIEQMGDAPNLALALEMPSEILEQKYQQGLSAYRAGDYQQALEAFIGVALACSDNGHVLLALGNTLQQLHDYSAALTTFLMAQYHLPQDAGVLFRIAECQLELDQPELARATLRDCLALCNTSTSPPGLYQHVLSLIDRIN